MARFAASARHREKSSQALNMFHRATVLRLIAIIATGLMVASLFPPYSFSMFAWICMIPLLIALWSINGKHRAKKGFLIGYLAGAISFGIQVSWLSTVSWLGPIVLAVWLVASFGAFVLVGSIALMAFFQHLTKVEEKVALESLGRTNALFLDQSNLPQSEYMAEQLGRVMGAEVEFRYVSESSSTFADGLARRLGDLLSVGFKLKNGGEVWFSRESYQLGVVSFWKRLDAQFALGGFWAHSLLFSVWIGRKVTRPLAKLAAAIPEIGGDQPLIGLPTSGPQEIVSLANALSDAHGSLVEEREKRRHAERLALLGRMATSLAHEVRNPVSAA